MSVFRLLMRRLPDAVAAGDIGRALSVKPSTLSVYLSALLQTGLVIQARSGTSLLYRARPEAAADIVNFLYHDCCRGRPGLCPPTFPSATHEAPMPEPVFNVLFICSGNSARSLFAEAILRDLAPERFVAYSAGTHPKGGPNPQALEVLSAKGHDISQLRSKGIATFQKEGAPVMDFVFTVCDQAANEECPAWHGQPISAHWGVPDPVAADGTEAERKLAFQQAYGLLRNRLRAFTALRPEALDRVTLQRAVDHIALQNEDEST